MALCRVAEQDLGHRKAPLEEDIRRSIEETIKLVWLITIHTSSRKRTITFRRPQAWITNLGVEVEVVAVAEAGRNADAAYVVVVVAMANVVKGTRCNSSQHHSAWISSNSSKRDFSGQLYKQCHPTSRKQCYPTSRKQC